MRILVIPDVHLKPWMFDAAEMVDKSKYDLAVCLGDLVDDWDEEYNTDLYDRTMQRVLKFDKEYPDTLWCLGNHDFSYLWGHPESGFSSMQTALVASHIEKLRGQAGKRLGIVHDVDGVLFSHAGLKDSYAKKYFKNSYESKEQLLRAINYAWKDELKEEKLWQEDSPIWLRPPGHFGAVPVPYLYGQSEEEFLENKLLQVAGHTPVKRPGIANGLLIVDTFSTYSDGVTRIGDGKFVIVDTKERTWEYA